MQVAVIEDNVSFQNFLKNALETNDWHTDFFSSPSEFGRVKLEKYDVILVDYHLPNINGRDLIKSISDKTKAEILLMSETFEEEDKENQNIKGLFHKEQDIEHVIDQLKYIDAKIRINKCMEEEKEVLENLAFNGYSIEKDNDIAIIGIKEPLSKESKDIILRKMKEFKKIIFSFLEKKIVPSIMLGDLTFLYKEFIKRKCKITFFNESKSIDLKTLLVNCSLDKLFPIFDSLEEAKSYLNASV